MSLEKWVRGIRGNKYVLLVFALGLGLLLLPGSFGAKSDTSQVPAGQGDPLAASGIPLDTEGERLAAVLRTIRGVGEAEVLLSRRGAVVVCEGADDARVCLAVTNAVSVYTGLGSDKITVMKLQYGRHGK